MSCKRDLKYDEVVKMYEQGLSIQNIADFYKTSRQSMWQILKTRGCKFRDNLKFGKQNHFYRGGEIASDLSHNILEHAIEVGKIIRILKCEKCGSVNKFKDGRTAIQAHHINYNEPLKVMWLCRKCHFEWHKNNKAIPVKGEIYETS